MFYFLLFSTNKCQYLGIYIHRKLVSTNKHTKRYFLFEADLRMLGFIELKEIQKKNKKKKETINEYKKMSNSNIIVQTL